MINNITPKTNRSTGKRQPKQQPLWYLRLFHKKSIDGEWGGGLLGIKHHPFINIYKHYNMK